MFLELVTWRGGGWQELWEEGPIGSWGGAALGTWRVGRRAVLGITWSAVEGMKLEPVAGAMGAGQVVEGGGEVVLVSGGLGAGCRPAMLIALVFVSFFFTIQLLLLVPFLS